MAYNMRTPVRMDPTVPTRLAARLAALALALIPLLASAAPRTERGQLAHDLVLRWGVHVQQHYGADVHEWSRAMVPVMARVPLARLRAAVQARDFDAMNRALMDAAPGANPDLSLARALDTGLADSRRVVARALGEPDTDLVFVPVTPCRLLDTRVAGGAIAANTSRGFDVSGAASFTAQGGDAAACGLGSVDFAAAAINVTVVTPSAAGYLTAYPFGLASPPAASTVNYGAGDVRGNFAIVKLDQSAATHELALYSFAQTHVVADIVGYFAAPAATALDCIDRVSTVSTISAGATATLTAPTCTAGYTLVGGGCTASSTNARLVSSRTSGASNAHVCVYLNQGTGGVDVFTQSRCCRLPGR